MSWITTTGGIAEGGRRGPFPSVLRLLSRYEGVSWALVDQAMVSAANFLTGILLARYLGVEAFGRFTLLWIVVLFAQRFQSALIVTPMMSIGPKQSSGDAPAYYGAVVLQQVAFSVFLLVLVLAGASLWDLVFTNSYAGAIALPLAVVALAHHQQEFLRRYFFARRRGMGAFVSDAIRYLGQLVLLVWLLRAHTMNVALVLWTLAAAAGLSTLAGYSVLGSIHWNLAALRRTARQHWLFGRWLLASSVMQWSSSNVFLLAAGGLLGAAAVGAMKAAHTLMGVTNIFYLGLHNVIPVRAASQYVRGGAAALVSYLRKASFMGELAMATMVVVLSAAPAFWLTLAFGEGFAEYDYVLRWYSAIFLLMFLTLPLEAGLNALEHTRPLFAAYSIGALLAAVTVYPMVSWFGLSGVMAGLLAVWFVQLGVLAGGLTSRLRQKAANA